MELHNFFGEGERDEYHTPTPEEGVVSETDKCILPTWIPFGLDTVADGCNVKTEGEQVGGKLVKVKLNLTRDEHSMIQPSEVWNKC